MKNILKSDFYKLLKSKSFYICTLIAGFLFGLQPFLLKLSFNMMNNIDGMERTLPFKSGMSHALSAFTGGDTFLFMAIVIATFVASDYNHGTMKNVVSKGFSRISIYLSKVITMTAACLVMLLFQFVVGLIAAGIVTGKITVPDLEYGTAGQVLRMVGIEILLNIAVVALYVMISILVRNTGVAIAINIVGVIYFGRLIFQILDLIFKAKESFTRFSLLDVSYSFYNKIIDASGDLIRAVLVGVAYLAVSIAAGIYAFKKMDVK
jgi:ABC-2 type transport system permease protein